MSKMYLKNFISKFCWNRDFCVWCPDHSSVLYFHDDFLEASMIGSPVQLFDYMIVDDVCVNGECIQINCHFNDRKWNKDLKYYEEHLEELPIYEA